MTLSTQHGGSRPGAGRKPGSGPFGEPTQPVRIPASEVGTVVEYLAAVREQRALEAEGVRATDPRGVGGERVVHIPVLGCQVPAGFPSPADDYVEDVIDLNTHLIRKGHEAATFVVRAKGFSMIGAGIHDGDEILVDRAIDPVDGMVVVAAVNGELLIKRLRIRAGKLVLVSENPHYPERIIAEGENLEIWGVATRVLHAL